MERVRTDRYKYIAYSDGDHREQFFDMSEDPLETVDISRAANAQPVIEDHRERLRRWCEATDDVFRQGGE